MRENNFFTYINGHNSGTNVRKMMCNNYNVDLVKMKEYLNLSKFCSFVRGILRGNEILV